MEQIQRTFVGGPLRRPVWAWMGLFLVPLSALGCGLDWTLPLAHFEGVDEDGYVAYWQKIGEIDMGDKVVLPVHIGFNSHREASSSILGKGWIVPLLESHVEPINENAMNVIMPDGWTFLFLRNANSETWRGNAGWMGETDDSIFTISAPCGWRIKFDHGKIQEIDDDKIGALTYRYNGGVPTEIDHDGEAVLQVEQDPASGAATALVIAGRRIELSLAQRPRVVNMLGRNLLNGFDLSVASLQGVDGGTETFSYGTDKGLNPTLTIKDPAQFPRTLVWDGALRQIKSDGGWTYSLQPEGDHLRFTRVSRQNQAESYEDDQSKGMTAVKSADGAEIATYRFVSGPLAGRVRKIEELENGGASKLLYSASYYPSGQLMREIFSPDEMKMYSETRQLLKETIQGRTVFEQDLDSEGRVVHIVDSTKFLEVKRVFAADGGQTTQVFRKGTLFYTEQIDSQNKLVSINETNK